MYSKGHLNELWTEVKGVEEIWEDLKGEARQWVKTLIGVSLEQGIKGYIGADRYERASGRTTHRNGCYKRSLETELGLIQDIPVPRSRDGRWRPSGVFQRYQRRREGVNRSIREMFLGGVSTRRVGEVMHTLLGYKVSAQGVSQATKELDHEVKRYRQWAGGGVERDLSQGSGLSGERYRGTTALYGLPTGTPKEDTHHQRHREGLQGGQEAYQTHKLF